MIRAYRPEDEAAVRRVVTEAFTGHGPEVAELVESLRATHGRAELVAEEDGEVVGHVLLSLSWVDARRSLVEVLVLSPLGVLPERQRQGLGTALVAAALDEARRLGAPAVFLEGDPAYYSGRGFEAATPRGFVRPSVRIPEPGFQVAVLDALEDWMTGALVYAEPFWLHDKVGLRDPRLTLVEQAFES
jgi:putative acetyltransferase